LLPRRAADILALPDGAPSKVASRASMEWLAAFHGVHNAPIGHCRVTAFYSGSSGSGRALRFGELAEADAVERTKLQRIEGRRGEPWRITIWAERRGPSFPARNTLSSSETFSSSASKVQTSRLGNTSMTPRASLRRLALTEGCR